MKEPYEVALDVLAKKVGLELEWAVDEVVEELKKRAIVIRCKNCSLAEYQPNDILLWCKHHEIWIAREDFCSQAISREQAMREDAALFDHDPKDELADLEYHRRKENPDGDY